MTTKSNRTALCARRIKHNKHLIFGFKRQEKVVSLIQPHTYKCKVKFLLPYTFIPIFPAQFLSYLTLLSCCPLSFQLVWSRISTDVSWKQQQRLSKRFPTSSALLYTELRQLFKLFTWDTQYSWTTYKVFSKDTVRRTLNTTFILT